jgi:hypothetical protein
VRREPAVPFSSMWSHSMCTVTRLASLLTAAWCLAAPGCISSVTWTPDSKGFYFTGGKDYNKLLYFDVAAKRARVVVADFKGMTHWPAVSPDGKRVAVAAVVHYKGVSLYQVVVYDVTGKKLRRLVPVVRDKPEPPPVGPFAKPPAKPPVAPLVAPPGV